MVLLAAGPQEPRISVLLVGIAVVLLAGLVLGRAVVWLRQPVVIGEIAAGIALGPSLLGRLPGGLPDLLFPEDVRPILSGIAQVGLVLFMFALGWEFERRLIRPYAALAAGVSLASIALPFGLGMAAAVLLHPHYATVAGKYVPFVPFAVFMGVAMSATAFPVMARILADRGLQGTRVGVLALASAAIDDVLAWFLLAFVSILVVSEGGYPGLVRTGGLSLLYVVLMLLVVRPLLERLVRWGVGTDRWSVLVTALIAGAFISSWLTSWIGIHAIFGAFLFGFVMPREHAEPIVRRLRAPVEDIGLVFLPVFFVVTGLNVDLSALVPGDYLALALLLVVACVGKMVGAFVPARLSGFTRREAADLALLMNTRGLTELIILNVGVGLGVLDGRIFTLLVVVALVTSAMTGPLLSRKPASPTGHVVDLVGSRT
ncbi:cation:proton antiporter [Nocardiopsis sp. YSL2]|uniref:cation:proton antiporter n=1 Tax=Nocardiopsis sp. YSL2 TaxID=2939492 RepID=UPI0026F4611B|nr:cation:proton antiporter [Nocardiopsis sp. YSL2]